MFIDVSFEVVIFFVLLIDAVVANIVAWLKPQWYRSRFGIISRYFPVTKGWTTYYLILVLWIGYLLIKFGVL